MPARPAKSSTPSPGGSPVRPNPLTLLVLDLRGPGPDGTRPEPIDLRPPRERAADAGGAGPEPARQGLADPVEPGVLASLTGEEIAPAGAPIAEFRAAAKTWAAEHLIGQKVASEALGGREVGFNKVGVNKAATGRRGEVQFQVYAALPDLVAHGRLIGSEAPRDLSVEPTVKAYHTIQGTVALGDARLDVRVIVREGPAGDFHYDHSVIKEKAAEPAPASHPPQAPKGPGNAGDGTQAGGPSGNIGPGAGAAKPDPIASDPALKALFDDTEALAAAEGIELPAGLPSEDPATLAEAVRAAAICLAVELGE
jgi:hypothetical protein